MSGVGSSAIGSGSQSIVRNGSVRESERGRERGEGRERER